MNKDFRVSVTLPTHPKTLKLMRKLGDRAFYNLIRLWAFVSANKPNGVLSGYDEDDIEIASDWTGEPGLFVKNLLDPKIRFLEKTDDGFLIHDWQDHNEYAFHADERSDKAKKAARARWNKDSEKPKNTTSNAKLCTEHAASNATSINKQCPSPSPSPSPSPDKSSLTNVSGGPLADKKKSNHFREKTGNYFKEIKAVCEKIAKSNLDGFNSYKFVQSQINNRGHPGAILESLNGILKSQFPIEKPWGFVNAIMRRENGNFNEADAIKIHQEMKNLKPGELSNLTHGLFDKF